MASGPNSRRASSHAIAGRDDVLKLQTFAQSDLTPYLWRGHRPDGEQREPAPYGDMAEDLLQQMNPGVKLDFKQPEEKLVAAARTFYDHSARFAATKTNPDGSPATVPLWVWDAKDEKLVEGRGRADRHRPRSTSAFATPGGRSSIKPDYELAQAADHSRWPPSGRWSGPSSATSPLPNRRRFSFSRMHPPVRSASF